MASSIAHDSHNLIIAGTDDRDMQIAGNCVRKNKGGLAVVVDGIVVGELPLPIAGLMTDASAVQVEETLAFVSLPVIPKLRLNTYGVIDVDEQKVVAAVF